MAFEYLFTALPALPADLGSNVPMTPARFAALCSEEGGPASLLARAILLQVDLRALELLEFGLTPSETACLSEAELRERRDLPEWLSRALASDPGGFAVPFDRVWKAYFEELIRLGCAHGSGFLVSWVPWEVGLRGAVSKLRAQRASESDRAFLIEGLDAERASTFRPTLDALVSLFEGGFDAWAGMERLLGGLRLSKLRELAPSYTFTLDELLGYAAQYVILRGSRYLSR